MWVFILRSSSKKEDFKNGFQVPLFIMTNTKLQVKYTVLCDLSELHCKVLPSSVVPFRK
jgi:hypothetical protein